MSTTATVRFTDDATGVELKAGQCEVRIPDLEIDRLRAWLNARHAEVLNLPKTVSVYATKITYDFS